MKIFRIAQKVTEYSIPDGLTPHRDPDAYFSIGHGDFNDEGDISRYVVWVFSNGKILTSEDQDKTHGTAWGHHLCDMCYKGRYEPETGRLSIVKPERQKFRDVPNVLWRALRSEFDNITDVHIF